MTTFYFNTGVNPHNVHNPEFSYDYHRKVGNVIKGGVLQLPFDCDAPANARLLFLCDNPNLPESKIDGVIVREVSNTTILSKYAYLKG